MRLKVIIPFLFLVQLAANPVALITGVNGQDGSYLAEYLLNRGYKVHGTVRSLKNNDCHNVLHLQRHTNFTLHPVELTEVLEIDSLIQEIKPNEIYNLAAQSNVKRSFDEPLLTAEITGFGIVKICEACKRLKHQCKIFQPSSSELSCENSNLTEFHPKNPYAIAKLYALWMGRYYRDTYQMFISNGILFNHESPRRPETFVTGKIVKGLIQILQKKLPHLELGNIAAKRDFGFALDYIEAMHLMLMQEKPDDIIIASGTTHSIKEFIEAALDYLGIEVLWQGSGINETATVTKIPSIWKGRIEPGQIIIKINPEFFRPVETNSPPADISKAEKILHWTPKTTFAELVKIMIDETLEKEGIIFKREGLTFLKNHFPYLEKP